MTTETSQNIVTGLEAVLVPAASVVAPLIGGPTIAAIIELAAKYGPEAIHGIIALFKPNGATAEEVIAAFTKLKPYSAYGIKNVSER